MERMTEEGYINPQQPPQVTPPPDKTQRGQVGAGRRTAQNRGALRNHRQDHRFSRLQNAARICWARSARSSFGRHDTRDLATGVESGGISRHYEFGDT